MSGIDYPMAASILVVEDEFLVALEMQSILEENGYRVLGIAADLAGAMEYASQSIDLALVDLNLRDGLTGPQIGERLANEYDAAVLFVTANPRMLGDGVAGTIGVLTKPTDEETLLAATRFALRYREDDTAEAPAAVFRFR
jgi:DNA-binding response OmpR family regulator